jgi:hypothetical protein
MPLFISEPMHNKNVPISYSILHEIEYNNIVSSKKITIGLSKKRSLSEKIVRNTILVKNN